METLHEKYIPFKGEVKREEFVRNDRIAKLRELVFPKKPEICVERARLVTEAYREFDGEPIDIKRAKMLDKVLGEMTIYILEGALIVGNTASSPRGGRVYPEYGVNWLDQELDTIENRAQDPYSISDENKKVLREEIFPYWRGKTMDDFVRTNMPEEIRGLEGKLYAFGLLKNATGSAHLAIDSRKIVETGWGGLKKKAQEKLEKLAYEEPGDVDKGIFYRAVIIALDAAAKYSRRYAAFARRLAQQEKDTQRKWELEQIAGNCDWIAENPPKTYWQALQLIFFTNIIPILSSHHHGTQVGRVDQYLYPFYKKETEAGTLTEDFARDIMEAWYCIQNADFYQLLDADVASRNANFAMGGVPTSGGQLIDGSDATNDLSYMLLQCEEHVRLAGPESCVRIHENTPDDFLREVCRVISIGTGKPKLFMDETFYKRGANSGYTMEQMRDYQGAFCAESSLPGQTYWVPENAMILGGFGMYTELALNNGVSRMLGEQIGLATGDPRQFKTFDEVMDAYKKQVAYLIHRILPAKQLIMSGPPKLVPDPFVSAIMDDCLEKGKDWERGGARYNTFGYMTVGSAVAGNSLAAIKKVVFDDKKITMAELIDALDANFEGPKNEEIRQMLLRAPKFGNDDDYVDDLIVETIQIDIDEYQKYEGPQGGRGVGTYDAVTNHIPFGSVVGATPDGRKAGDPLNEGGVSPYQGTDKEGPTAVLKSVAKMPWTNPGMYGGVLNVRLDPKSVKEDGGMEKLMAFIRAFNRLGGQEIQFNCIDEEVLKEAQEKPRDYDNLLVRVAGYSSFFTGLARDVQDDIIVRTEQQL